MRLKAVSSSRPTRASAVPGRLAPGGAGGCDAAWSGSRSPCGRRRRSAACWPPDGRGDDARPAVASALAGVQGPGLETADVREADLIDSLSTNAVT